MIAFNLVHSWFVFSETLWYYFAETFQSFFAETFWTLKHFSRIFAETFWTLRHFGHLSHSTVLLKLTITVFISQYFQTF